MKNSLSLKLLGLILGTSLLLTGCDDFSGDQYTANQVKSVSNVGYGRIISIRDVKARNNKGDVGATTGALGGAVLGGVIGNAIGGPRGTGIGTLVGAAGLGVAGYAVGNRNVKVKEYMVELETDRRVIAITQKEPPALSLNQRVAIQYDASGAGRIVPA